MRLYWSVGLPGPFRVSGPIASTRTRYRQPRSRWHHPLYWMSGIALWEMAFWATLVVAVVAVWLVAAVAWGIGLTIAAAVTRSTRPYRLWTKLPPLVRDRARKPVC